MQQPSIQVRNLLETAVLQIQHSPDLNDEEVRWIQQFAAHLITEFSVLKEPDLLYAPLEDDTSVDNHGQLMNRIGASSTSQRRGEGEWSISLCRASANTKSQLNNGLPRPLGSIDGCH